MHIVYLTQTRHALLRIPSRVWIFGIFLSFGAAMSLAETDPNQGRPVTGVVYFHPNHIGSTALTTDEDGRQLASFVYEPYGQIHRVASSGPDNVRPKFSGKELDADTQLYYFEARFYDPYVGRFTTADKGLGAPSAHHAALNRYAYSANNPINVTDPSGRKIDIGAVPENKSGTATVGYVPLVPPVSQTEAPVVEDDDPTLTERVEDVRTFYFPQPGISHTPYSGDYDLEIGASFGVVTVIQKADGTREISIQGPEGSLYYGIGGGYSQEIKTDGHEVWEEVSFQIGVGGGGTIQNTGAEIIPVGLEIKVKVNYFSGDVMDVEAVVFHSGSLGNVTIKAEIGLEDLSNRLDRRTPPAHRALGASNEDYLNALANHEPWITGPESCLLHMVQKEVFDKHPPEDLYEPLSYLIHPTFLLPQEHGNAGGFFETPAISNGLDSH